MSDLEKSFAFLQDSIPQWLQDVARVQDKVTVMQDEVTKVAVSRSPFAKSTAGSVESIRSGKLDAIAEEAVTSSEAQVDVLGSRKRKTSSSQLEMIPDPSRHRPRTMVVVSYDGDVQKSLELLVRAIGTGRNLLRRARMESKMNRMAALATLSDEDEDDDNDAANEVDQEEAGVSTISYQPRMLALRARATARTSGRLGVSNASDPLAELFENTDKLLERAQDLCEKSAHLTLREGDCRKELDGIRKHFEDVLQIAKSEVVRCNARKSQEPPELLSHDTSDTSISSLEAPCIDHSAQASLPTLAPKTEPKILLQATSTTEAQGPRIVDLDVDDDDDNDEEDFVMPPIRLTSRLNARV